MLTEKVPPATIRWPDAATQIDVHEPHELSFWARRLRVSREMLKRAVTKVGPRHVDVDRYLYQKRSVFTHN